MIDPCPKCHYTRRPEDTAPDWQCPNCGIAYAKFLAHQQPLIADTSPVIRDASAPAPLQTRRTETLWGIVLAVVSISYALFHAMNGPEVRLEDAETRAAIFSHTNHKVVMYATQWCPYCARARSFFKSHNIDYLERDIEHDAEAERIFQDVLHAQGIPVIVIGDEVIRGYDEEAITVALSKIKSVNID
jgi:glutaredoxin